MWDGTSSKNNGTYYSLLNDTLSLSLYPRPRRYVVVFPRRTHSSVLTHSSLFRSHVPAREPLIQKNFKGSQPAFISFHCNTWLFSLLLSYRIVSIPSYIFGFTPLLLIFTPLPFRGTFRSDRRRRWTVQGDRGWDLVPPASTTSASTPTTSSTAPPPATGGSNLLASNTSNRWFLFPNWISHLIYRSLLSFSPFVTGDDPLTILILSCTVFVWAFWFDLIRLLLFIL